MQPIFECLLITCAKKIIKWTGDMNNWCFQTNISLYLGYNGR